MKRGFVILAVLVALAIPVYLAVYRQGTFAIRSLATSEAGELQWLRREFKVDEAGYQRILALHAAFDAECMAHCRDLEANNRRVLELARAQTSVTPELEESVRKLGEVREQCRIATLRHIYEVSAAMTPEEGLRYREMMIAQLTEVGPRCPDMECR